MKTRDVVRTLTLVAQGGINEAGRDALTAHLYAWPCPCLAQLHAVGPQEGYICLDHGHVKDNEPPKAAPITIGAPMDPSLKATERLVVLAIASSPFACVIIASKVIAAAHVTHFNIHERPEGFF